MNSSRKALCPSAYLDFRCIGPECEDSCCIGWKVTLDKPTFRLYKQNQHKLLRDRFNQVVKRNDAGKKEQFGYIKMADDGRCPFLDTENLCDIHKTLGETALSTVCSTFPRRESWFCGQVEYSLTLSCPEVARLILLNPEPMQFVEIPADPRFAAQTETPLQIGTEEALIRTDMRALSIAILQSRAIGIDARLIVLGLLVEDYENASKTPPDQRLAEQAAVLQHYAGMLAALSELKPHFESISPNEALRIHLVSALVTALLPGYGSGHLKNCLQEASQGLRFMDESPATDAAKVACHVKARQLYLEPFLSEHRHVLENYLVHYVFHTTFPYANGSPLAHYRELLATYLTASMLLLGISTHHRGLTAEQAARTLQAFTRLSGHNRKYGESVAQTLNEHQLTDICDLFPLLAHHRLEAGQ